MLQMVVASWVVVDGDLLKQLRQRILNVCKWLNHALFVLQEHVPGQLHILCPIVLFTKVQGRTRLKFLNHLLFEKGTIQEPKVADLLDGYVKQFVDRCVRQRLGLTQLVDGGNSLQVLVAFRSRAVVEIEVGPTVGRFQSWPAMITWEWIHDASNLLATQTEFYYVRKI